MTTLLEQLADAASTAGPGTLSTPVLTLSWDLDHLTVTQRGAEPRCVALHTITVQLSAGHHAPTTRRSAPHLVVRLRGPGLALQLDAQAPADLLDGLPHLDFVSETGVDLESLVSLVVALQAGEATVARFAAHHADASGAPCVVRRVRPTRPQRTLAAAALVTGGAGLALTLPDAPDLRAVLECVPVPLLFVVAADLRKRTHGAGREVLAWFQVGLWPLGVVQVGLFLGLLAFGAIPRALAMAAMWLGGLWAVPRETATLSPQGLEITTRGKGRIERAWTDRDPVIDAVLDTRDVLRHDADALRGTLEVAAGHQSPTAMLRALDDGQLAVPTDTVRWLHVRTSHGLPWVAAAVFVGFVALLAVWPVGNLWARDSIAHTVGQILMSGFVSILAGVAAGQLRHDTTVIDPHRLAIVARRDWRWLAPRVDTALAPIPAADFYVSAPGRSWRGRSLRRGTGLWLGPDPRAGHRTSWMLAVDGLSGIRATTAMKSPATDHDRLPSGDAATSSPDREVLLREARALRDDLAPAVDWTLEVSSERD